MCLVLGLITELYKLISITALFMFSDVSDYMNKPFKTNVLLLWRLTAFICAAEQDQIIYSQ